MLKKKRFLIGGIIIFLALVSLVYSGLRSSATFYFTVSELQNQGNLIYNETIRVKGQVAPGSVEQTAAGRELRFTIVEGGARLPVIYQGVVPDTFKEDVEVVVEGQLNSAGVFQANTLMPKCPSKYEPE